MAGVTAITRIILGHASRSAAPPPSGSRVCYDEATVQCCAGIIGVAFDFARVS